MTLLSHEELNAALEVTQADRVADPFERPVGHDDREGPGLLGSIGSQLSGPGAKDARRPVQFWGRRMTATNLPLTLEAVLDLFQMEEVHDGDVLARYVASHPQFAPQLIDFSRLIATSDTEDEGGLTATEQSRIDAAWINRSRHPRQAGDGR